MKVASVNFNYKYRNINSYSNLTSNISRPLVVPFFVSKLDSDIVSFSGNSNKLYLNDLRELPDLPCACCGKTMIENSKANDFLNKKIYYPAYISLKRIKTEGYFNESRASKAMNEAYNYLKKYSSTSKKITVSDILTKRTVKDARKRLGPETSAAFDEIRELTKLVAHNSKYMVDEISKIKPDFHKVEKRIFKELQRLAHAYPDETFFEILNKPDIHKYYLKNLEEKQIAILDSVAKVAKIAPTKIKKEIFAEINKARAVFKDESPLVLHKRGRVISSFHENLDKYKENSIVQNVFEMLTNLPDSKTDVDAFMIKGSQKNSNTIVEILINRQRNTFEHVKPHHREGDNGENSIYNYIGLCGKCNGERQRTEYDLFVKSHPEMIANAQIQLNRIIDYINKGLLTGYDKYPEKIKTALLIESKGKINVDIKRLDLDLAKVNRILRQQKYIEKKRAKSIN